MENSNIQYFKINGLVSANENNMRIQANLSPRPVHEELRSIIVEQQEREQRYVRMMQQAAFEIQDAFFRAGVRLAYLPEPLATDMELIDFALARHDPLDVKLQPFQGRIRDALQAQALRLPSARVQQSAAFVPAVAGASLPREGVPAIVYPSGVFGSQGLLIRIDAPDVIRNLAAFYLEREFYHCGCSVALWEFVGQSLRRDEVVLPDWAFEDHPGYYGRPPHALRVPLLDIESEEFLMRASPIFYRRLTPVISPFILTPRTLPMKSLSYTYGLVFDVDNKMFWWNIWQPRKHHRKLVEMNGKLYFGGELAGV